MTQSFLSGVIMSFHDNNQSAEPLDSASVAWDMEIISNKTHSKDFPVAFPQTTQRIRT